MKSKIRINNVEDCIVRGNIRSEANYSSKEDQFVTYDSKINVVSKSTVGGDIDHQFNIQGSQPVKNADKNLKQDISLISRISFANTLLQIFKTLFPSWFRS